ncbi:MAG TPA: thioredoxin family protein [Casimicrobiaceae bacterium]|nr:thioredoxin family protein [Casimicrobiaceae bacterium]
MPRRLILLLLCALAALALPAAAAPIRTGHVEAELVPEKTAITPGGTLTVALRLAMERGWHTYWRNPGESGLPTTLKWTLDEGLTAGAIQWPAPRALPAGPLMNYGYEDEVFLLTDIGAPSSLAAGSTVALKARADWLVCREICIPEGADLSLAIPVADRADPDLRWAAAIARTRAELPRPLEGWSVTATGRGDHVDLVLVPAAAAGDPGEIRFFPYSEGKIEPSAPQPLTRQGSELKLTLPVSSQQVGDFTRLAGVLTASRGFAAGSAATIDVRLAGSVVAGRSPGAAPEPLVLADARGGLSLGLALLFALVGGVLLNLMPCVFPVLSLKVFGFATHGGGIGPMRAHGLAFGAGVIASFALLAGALIALRAGGVQLGWGFQLQSPVVVAALALLFFVLALNLSGVFEIGHVLPSAVASWSARNSYVNDALSGVLAVAVASPCSAPFMGAAIGFALAQSAAATLAVFATLGAGMALPYVALAFFPAWRRYLPRPGPWMVRLKRVLAFPLYATVIWLAWVLGAQLDNDAVARLGVALLLVALALWAWEASRTGGSARWRWAAAASLIGAVIVGAPVAMMQAGGEPVVKTASAERGAWQDYAPERVRQLTGSGRPVFVDFTAAWCVTCQVNKRLVLNTEVVQRAFAEHDVALLRADWTRRDATIGRALAALGRSGVPVYVLYRPGREPVLLPEVLSQGVIIDALANPEPARLVTEAK